MKQTFGAKSFASWTFRSGNWTGVSSGVVVPTARTLQGAIAERVYETPALYALLPGGATMGAADREPRGNYASITDVGQRAVFTTEDSYSRENLLRVTIYAHSVDQLFEAGDLWVKTFKKGMAPLQFFNGGFAQVVSQPMVYSGEDQDTDGETLFVGMIDMQAWTGHSL